MDIGNKIKELRISVGLTQQELADRSELTKGFISQVERDLTSPSVESLLDILEALGTDPTKFFQDSEDEKIVFCEEDYFELNNEELNYKLNWIVPNAQKNLMEPTLIELSPNGKSKEIEPYEGEEFGYVISGKIKLYYGEQSFYLKKGDTFYFRAKSNHHIENPYKSDARVIWISSPPNF